MKRRHDVVALIFSIAFLAIHSGCTKKYYNSASTGLTELPASTGVVIVSAGVFECASGGVILKTYEDSNRNGVFDPGESILSETPVCNGANGSQGAGAGILVGAASVGSCPAGGTEITTFQDVNNNGAMDGGESPNSVSTICNGVNGSNGTNGTNSVITSVAANASQCPSGGVVYTTHTGSDPDVVAIVCNGNNGSNGSNANFQIAAVGNPVPAHSFTACHHDALYIPSDASNRGWLIFRHQQNGSGDQGIGTTGFNVWNIDISDFNLASEVGSVVYCQLHWDPNARKLDFTVVETAYGMAGQTGSIQF